MFEDLPYVTVKLDRHGRVVEVKNRFGMRVKGERLPGKNPCAGGKELPNGARIARSEGIDLCLVVEEGQTAVVEAAPAGQQSGTTTPTPTPTPPGYEHGGEGDPQDPCWICIGGFCFRIC